MKTVNMQTAYTWDGKIYGPGEDVEIPDGLHEALGLETQAAEPQAAEPRPASRLPGKKGAG